MENVGSKRTVLIVRRFKRFYEDSLFLYSHREKNLRIRQLSGKGG